MANVTVTGQVFKLEPNPQGFYKLNIKDDSGNWHNNISLGVKQKPKTFDNGDTIKLTYNPDDWSNLVGRPELVQKKQAGGNGGGYQGRGGNKGGKGGGYQGKSGGNQDQIMRQSCMGYAATLVAAVAKKTAKPEDLAKDTVKIAEEVLFKYASGGKEALPELFSNQEQAPQQQQQQSSSPQANQNNQPDQDSDFDSDIPF